MRCDRIAMIALLQPYECEVCSARFSQSNSLNVHKRGVHDKPRFDPHSAVEDKVPFPIHPPSPDECILHCRWCSRVRCVPRPAVAVPICVFTMNVCIMPPGNCNVRNVRRHSRIDSACGNTRKAIAGRSASHVRDVPIRYRLGRDCRELWWESRDCRRM